jgi:hypothetical protein
MSGATGNGGVASDASKDRRGATLNQRIRAVESRLGRRQRSVRLHAAGLHQNLREKLSNPVALLLAVGAGFALGQFTRHKRIEETASGDLAPASPSLFARLMEVLSLVSTIMALFPANRSGPLPETEGNGEVS